jgi:hypothetical protein
MKLTKKHYAAPHYAECYMFTMLSADMLSVAMPSVVAPGEHAETAIFVFDGSGAQK